MDAVFGFILVILSIAYYIFYAIKNKNKEKHAFIQSVEKKSNHDIRQKAEEDTAILPVANWEPQSSEPRRKPVPTLVPGIYEDQKASSIEHSAKQPGTTGKEILIKPSELKKAIVWAEILGPPRGW